MTGKIQFVTTSDGVRIAYRTTGAGRPLVFVRGWISHLEWLGREPVSRSFFEALASVRTVVQYDARGNGLSDREPPGLELEDLSLDIEAIADHLGLETFDLYGQTFGGPIAITYASAHPERVSKLILDGTFARGSELATPEMRAAFISGIRVYWAGMVRVFDDLTHPNLARDSSALGPTRDSISAEVAARLYDLAYRLDVSELLASTRAPTLVMHRIASRAIPFRLGRELASQIPGARFVPLEGSAHNPWSGDMNGVLEAIGDFLGEPIALKEAPDRSARRESSVTILFTDMASSTALTGRLGDAGAQELVRAHNRMVREALNRHQGREIKHTGDGIMASFASATAGLECAIDIQRAVASHNEAAETPFRVCVGLNAGEPVEEASDLFGTAVQLAARITDRAQPGEILLSNVVRELVSGKGFRFSDRGETELKGFDEPVRLFELKHAE